MNTRDQPWLLLCVDDEPNILRSLQRSFLDEPWEICTADGGEEALAIVGERRPDVILSDYRMPGMNGVEFLQQAKRVHADSIRIVLSGYADLDVILAALNEGEVYRFLSKPWNDGELRDVIRKAIGVKHLSDQNKSLQAELERSLAERTAELHAKRRALVLNREVLELLPLPILVINEQGTVTFANAESRTLLSTGGEDPVGLPAPPLVAGRRERFSHSSNVPGVVVRHMGPFVHKGKPVGAVIMTIDVEAFARHGEPVAAPGQSRTAMSSDGPTADPMAADSAPPPTPFAIPDASPADSETADSHTADSDTATESGPNQERPALALAAADVDNTNADDPGPLPPLDAIPAPAAPRLRYNDEYFAELPSEPQERDKPRSPGNGEWNE